MANRTITALYETRNAAEDAKTRLSAIDVSKVDIHDETSAMAANKTEGGFMAGLKNMFGAHEDTHGYAEGLRRGHFLLTATVAEEDTDEAIRVLDATGAVDFDQRQNEWRGAGWGGASAEPMASTNTARTGDDTIQLMEEKLVVGKREVDRGGVRVRSYVVETPVSQQVNLRDEHVEVERRPVNRPVTDTETAFREQTIEMTETGEEAVVGKEAYVKEELVINKKVGERTEEIKDTVRHTEVEVERLPGSTKPARDY